MTSLFEAINSEFQIYSQRISECLHNETELNTILYQESERTLRILCVMLMGEKRFDEIVSTIGFSGFIHYWLMNDFYHLVTTEQE